MADTSSSFISLFPFRELPAAGNLRQAASAEAINVPELGAGQSSQVY